MPDRKHTAEAQLPPSVMWVSHPALAVRASRRELDTRPPAAAKAWGRMVMQLEFRRSGSAPPRVSSFTGTVIGSEARQPRWGTEYYCGNEIATSLRSSR